MAEQEMIRQSEVIAIVDISVVEKTKTKGDHWTYRQKASAIVSQTLKGSPQRDVSLYGDEDFICAQVKFQPGRYLVFLHHDGDLLVGSNWHLSVRPIRDTQIEWYVPGELLKLSWQRLDKVLGRIRRCLQDSLEPGGS
jgi:hypothetical protein